ncbi:hypothetical protein B0T18DRAFT_413962 [Schizothecium vesticola]|uniref:Uncharacterized protein n=1 Tax=Schizothecium vesticola TaxID=314040 RepID=A0AA40K1V1_9PEZI|nr:hypothetical protein B0T18DRAFT_413962 [Schizothecium vesticola]
MALWQRQRNGDSIPRWRPAFRLWFCMWKVAALTDGTATPGPRPGREADGQDRHHRPSAGLAIRESRRRRFLFIVLHVWTRGLDARASAIKSPRLNLDHLISLDKTGRGEMQMPCILFLAGDDMASPFAHSAWRGEIG